MEDKNNTKIRFTSIINTIIVVAISIAVPISAGAETTKDQIDNLQQQILTANTQLTDVEKDIQNIDNQISKKILLLEEINQELVKLNNKSTQIQKQKSQNLEQLNKLKTSLKKQLETSYIINRNNNISKLSNITNVHQLSRFINYLEGYNNYNNSNITEIKKAIKNIETIDSQLVSLSSQQEQNKLIVKQSYEDLKILKENNLNLKSKLQQTLNSKLATLDYYQKQYSKLNDILDMPTSSSTNSNNIQTKKVSSGIFQNAKGKLPIPVSGMLDINFKNKKSKNAVFIKTNEGKKVRAIFSGTIVFSNWLRGFGFLTIIDHGDGYMSLYGNNQTLLKASGSIVEAGEAIALSGSSGGITTPGLYFEIRHNGSPINTIAWLNSDLTKDIG